MNGHTAFLEGDVGEVKLSVSLSSGPALVGGARPLVAVEGPGATAAAGADGGGPLAIFCAPGGG